MAVTTVDLGNVRGPQGEPGPAGTPGAAGPNQVTTSTATNITGLLKGTGSAVAQAIVGTDYAAPLERITATYSVNNSTATKECPVLKLDNSNGILFFSGYYGSPNNDAPGMTLGTFNNITFKEGMSFIAMQASTGTTTGQPIICVASGNQLKVAYMEHSVGNQYYIFGFTAEVNITG